jgi:hypothetical protein
MTAAARKDAAFVAQFKATVAKLSPEQKTLVWIVMLYIKAHPKMPRGLPPEKLQELALSWAMAGGIKIAPRGARMEPRGTAPKRPAKRRAVTP